MTSAIFGYARTSTAEQHTGLDAQVRDLLAAGAAPDAIFAEQVSSVASRPKFGPRVLHPRVARPYPAALHSLACPTAQARATASDSVIGVNGLAR